VSVCARLRSSGRLVGVAFALALAGAGCGGARGAGRSALSSSPTHHVLRAGDEIVFDVTDLEDGARLVLDARGAVDVPWCGRVALAGFDRARAEGAIARCLVAANVFTERPLVHVEPPRRTATVIVGAARATVPTDEGTGLLEALVSTLVGPPPDEVVVERAGVRHRVDVGAILRGDEANPALEPDDRIVVSGARAVRAAPRPPPSRAHRFPWSDVAERASTATCGELVLLDASASARHEGDRHPALVAIRTASRARCTPDDVTKTLARACREAHAMRLEELARGTGPANPRVRALDAAIAKCPPLDAAPVIPAATPTPEECAALRAHHAALVDAGKGDRHPEMIETTARLEACP
jgi:hypothetical protein